MNIEAARNRAESKNWTGISIHTFCSYLLLVQMYRCRYADRMREVRRVS